MVFGQVRCSKSTSGWPFKYISFSASRTSVGQEIRSAMPPLRVKLENFCNGSVRRGLTHHEPCLVYSPFCGGRTITSLQNLAVEFRSVFLLDGSDVTFPLIREPLAE